MARVGRGRLSSLDLLPEEAEDDVLWAFGQLKANKKTQVEILESLNLRLSMKGIEPISSSAFNRKAMRLNKMSTRLSEAREIAGVLANRFEDGSDEELTLLVSETIKMLVYETLERVDNPKADVFSSEMLGNLANALKSAEQAKRISVDTRSRIEKDFKVKAEDAVEQVAKTKGLSQESTDALKAALLGIRRPEKGA